MKKLIKYLSCLLIAMLACTSIISCGGDEPDGGSDDEQGIIDSNSGPDDGDDVDFPVGEDYYGNIVIEKIDYYRSGDGYACDGTTNYHLKYEDGRPVLIVNHQASANYSWESERRAYFSYDDEGVMVNTETADIDSEGTGSSQHYAQLKDGRAVKGWYKWEDEDKVDWEATYDNAGYLASTKNNDGTSTWDTYTYSWKDGCIEKIVWTANKRVVLTYAFPDLENLHSTFDLNWVITPDIECYCFAAGDDTRMFAATGLMGNQSSLLLTAITEYTSDSDTYSYRMNYEENSLDRTVVTVMYFHNDIQYGYSKWTINYDNIK
jgi:hypothetical protein